MGLLDNGERRVSPRMREYRAAYPWFGGKQRVAELIWDRLGRLDVYIEPFFGSGATLLRVEAEEYRTDIVNDLDAFVANFWRSVQQYPDEVAKYADWPCNEVDLNARNAWLASRKSAFSEKLWGDPNYCNPKFAGWWVWGLCWWIGGSWAEPGSGPWVQENGLLVNRSGDENGVRRRLPKVAAGSQGVARKRPCVGGTKGVSGSTEDVGVTRGRPQLNRAGGVGAAIDPGVETYTEWVHYQIQALQDRMRRVRVCSGDWSRVLTPAVTEVTPTSTSTICGVFVDPPYSMEAGRDNTIYATDAPGISDAVRKWCLENGDNPQFRICLAGYEGEHVMPSSWSVLAWRSSGMSNGKTDTAGSVNQHRERLWFSPHCLPPRRGE